MSQGIIFKTISAANDIYHKDVSIRSNNDYLVLGQSVIDECNSYLHKL